MSRQSLLDEYQQAADEKWQGDEVCPTCQRPLPEDEVDQAQEAFNLSKSKRLEKINQKGQKTCSKEMIAALESEIIELADNIQTTESTVSSHGNFIGY